MDENIHMTKPGEPSFSIVDPDWLIKIKETDDSEYRLPDPPKPAVAIRGSAPGWFTELYTKAMTKPGPIKPEIVGFAIGALVSSIIWFAILLWLLKL
ncbi:hypothetical protein LCGC14_0400870 [marine sediment metagenome]|uniref:Uncharacterized protein n=1 Tax=marine sediment metagenome TaxID=412755 RepID=A0A0F9T2E2_9ZZZZ